MKILKASGVLQELAVKFADGNHIANIHIALNLLANQVGGKTEAYPEDNTIRGKQYALFDMRNDNAQMNLQPVIDKTLNKNKQTIIINLNITDVKAANSNIHDTKELAFTIVHEIVAHALKMKSGQNNDNEVQEHSDFYNLPTTDKIISKGYSPDYDNIKENSIAGKFKKRIEDAAAKLKLDAPQKSKSEN